MLKAVVQASAEYETWYRRPTGSCMYGPRTAKSACRCSGVKSGTEGGCTEPERMWARPVLHRCACLETSYTGTHYALKIVPKINKAADRCSTLRNEGTDCTELCAVAPKKKLLCNVAICFRVVWRIATLHNGFSLVRQHRAQCSQSPHSWECCICPRPY
jgi:hypothetical protein